MARCFGLVISQFSPDDAVEFPFVPFGRLADGAGVSQGMASHYG